MTTTNNSGVTFDVDGKAVTEAQLNLIVTESLGAIDTLTTNLSSIEKSIEKAWNDAKILSGEKVEGYEGEKKPIKDLKPVERRRFWSIGIKVIDDGESFKALKEMLKSTADVLKEVAGAQYDADKILADVLKYQRALAQEMKFLYGLAAVNAHQCDWVAKSITLRLKKASQGELNREEIECLNNVLQDIKTKQQFFALNAVGQAHESALEEQRKKDIEHDTELERQRGKDDEHDRELERQRKKDDEHDRQIKESFERIARIEKSGSTPIWVKASVIVSLLLSIAAMIMASAK